MIHLPTVLGLILCEHVEVDRDRRRFSLVGLFHNRRVPEFPTPLQLLTAYSALFDGTGEGTLELTVNQLDTGEDIYRYQRWMAFPRRMLTIHLEIKVTQCVFPVQGAYDVLLYFDGEELTRRRLDLYQA